MNGSSKPRILVVEDKPSEREALARLLKLEHYDVETANRRNRRWSSCTSRSIWSSAT
jgi:DNA-binding response OmpR family regulator